MDQEDTFETISVSPSKMFDSSVPDAVKSASTEGPNGRKTIELPNDFAGYEIAHEIGRGGMGAVFAATEKELGRKVAIKVLLSSGHPSDSQILRFRKEAQAAARLTHDHIVPIYNVGVENGTHFLSMQLIDGVDFARLLDSVRDTLKMQNRGGGIQDTTPDLNNAPKGEPQESSGRSSSKIELSSEHYSASMGQSGRRSAESLARSVAMIGIHAADALFHAHEQGVIHRDIKPANLMLDTEGKVWITDFGLALLRDSGSLTRTGDVIGTLRYMSPEQASGQRAFIDNRTDIYSLGVTLYELATLRHACRGRSAAEILRELTLERPIPVRKHNARLPRDFETIVCKATERNPADRYQTADELASDLRKFFDGVAFDTRRTSRWKHLRDWLYVRPGVIGTLAASTSTILLALSVAVWAAVSNGRIKQERLEENEQRISRNKEVTREIDSQRFRYAAQSELRNNPGRALMLARKSGEIKPSYEANQVMLSATHELHERKTLQLGDSKPINLRYDQNGEFVELLAATRSGIEFTRFTFPDGQVDLSTSVPGGSGANAVSSDGRFLLVEESTAEDDRTEYSGEQQATSESVLTLWATRPKGKLLARIVCSVDSYEPSAASFSPGGTQVVLPAANRSAGVYSVEDGSLQYLLANHTADVLSCLFSDDGKFIAVWTSDGKATIWATDGQRIRTLDYETEFPQACTPFFLTGNNYFVITGPQGTVVCPIQADAADAKTFYPEIEARAVAASNSLLLRGSRLLKIVDVQSTHVVSSVELDRRVTVYTLCNDDRFVASALGNSISVVDMQSGDKVAEFRGHEDWIASLAGHPSEGAFASVGYDQTIRYWDIQTDADRRTYPSIIGRTKPFTDFSVDGRFALFGPVTDIQTTVRRTSNLEQTEVKLSGEMIATIGGNQFVTHQSGKTTIWDATSAKSVASTTSFTAGLREALDLDGERLLCLTKSGLMTLWNWRTGHLESLNSLEDSASCFVLSRDRQLLFAGMKNGELRQHDLSDPYEHDQLAAFGAHIVDLDYDETTDSLVAVTKQNRAHTYSLQSRESSVVLKTDDELTNARFIGNSGRLLTYGSLQGKAIRLWDSGTGELLAKHECDGVSSLEVEQNGNWCAVASLKSGAFVWKFQGDQVHSITLQPTSCIGILNDNLILLATIRYPANAINESSHDRQASLIKWSLDRKDSEEQVPLNGNLISLETFGENGLISSARSSGMDVVELESEKIISRLRGHSSNILAAFFTESGLGAISVGSDGTILKHNVGLARQTPVKTAKFLPALATVSPDKKLLLLASESGRVQQWDMDTQTLISELENNQTVTQLQIGPDNFTALAIVGTKSVRRWDLRTAKSNDYQFQTDVHHVCLSPDCKTILVCNGKWPVIPAPSRKFRASTNRESQVDLSVIEIASGKLRSLRIPGRSVNAIFTDGGRNFALLNTFGRVGVYQLADFKQMSQNRSADTVLGLLGPSGGQQFWGNVHGHVVGWESTTGARTLYVPSRSIGKEATMNLENWQTTRPNCEWILVLDDSGVRRVPKDPLKYTEQVSPRPLEKQELERVGLTFVE
ncbi:MAG TPA: hypothetical protein DDW52_27285 [Planctomycetaceae bacterium]|nr:hypothetical protein [Planctomycetaceae bacterium]